MADPEAVYEQSYMSTMFPLTVVDNRPRAARCDGELIYCHWHDAMEFVHVEHGAATFTVASQRYHAEDGDIVAINPGEVHRAQAASGGVVAHAMVLNPEILAFAYNDTCQNSLMTPIRQGRLRLPTHLTTRLAQHKPIIAELRDAFTAHEAARQGHELYTKACILKAIALMTGAGLATAKAAAAGSTRSDRSLLLKAALRHIEDHYAAGIRVSDLAHIACLSDDRFYKAFRSLTGRTPIAYLNACRVEHATGLLAEGGMSVTDAALEVGFQNTSYFIRVFKRLTGLTPSRYATTQRVSRQT